jgi:hypothetical protein
VNRRRIDVTREDEDKHSEAAEIYMAATRERIAALEERIAHAAQLGEPIAILTATLDKCRTTMAAMGMYRLKLKGHQKG